MKISKLILIIFFIILSADTIFSQWVYTQKKLEKYTSGPEKYWTTREHNQYYKWRARTLEQQIENSDDDQILRRQKAILNGNKITTEIWNYGSISSPGNRVTDIIWEGLGYGYEFGPLICAEIPILSRSHEDAFAKVSESGDTSWYVNAISDGLVSLGGEVSPDGQEFWTWEPLAYNDSEVPYADPLSDFLPTSTDIDRIGDGKPDSWPEGWYNQNTKEYEWPGALRQGASNSDMESFFVVDDRMNKEFEYYPFPTDSTRRGLGLEIEMRYYQWSNPLAEDIIFLIYKVTNVSEKNLDQVTFGMWGDPHIGGPSNWQDDLSFFDKENNIVYAWDADNISDVAGREPGYFGYKFLESPGNPSDGIDNDDDGMVDESRYDGIDNDNDWDIEKDDLGVDGIPNTGDRGEGDGIPTAGDPFDIREPGEPNFEGTDLDESDMVGLTGFSAPQFGGNNAPQNDQHVYQNFLQPDVFDSAGSGQPGDRIFIYSSGPISLPAGASRKFSIALVLGQSFDDLKLNANVSQDIYEKNYQFAKPPEKPNVTVVPGDEKVTLYWDNIAESSVDPISEEQDFEGYAIYRSTDPQFLDQQTITDAYGTNFLFEPHKMANGASAKFDLINEYVGLSDIVYSNRGVYFNLGNNTGLRHSFVDSNNVINGQTYYYAVTSYDRGSSALAISPSECSKLITVNPERNETFLDVNTAKIIPRPRAAGYQSSYIDSDTIMHSSGKATGQISIEIIDQMAVEDLDTFIVSFSEGPSRYSVEDMKITDEVFTAKLDKYISLKNKWINETSFRLTSLDENTIYQSDLDFELDSEFGRIKALDTGELIEGEQYQVNYTFWPIKNSRLFNLEEANPVFDGMKIYLKDEELRLDTQNSGWSSSSNAKSVYSITPYNGNNDYMYPADYEVRFSSSIVDTGSLNNILTNFKIFEVTNNMDPVEQRFAVFDSDEEQGFWNLGERVILLVGEEGLDPSWEFRLFPPQEGENILPTDGDILKISTKRPFSQEDTYTFSTRSAKLESEQIKSDLDKINVVPNPYVVTNELEQLDLQNPLDRGPRRVYFNHLPQNCTISIYTIDGSLVNTLPHSSTIDDGIKYWDLTTKDNFPIAYGVYIYHIDAGEAGQKVGRFAVIK